MVPQWIKQVFLYSAGHTYSNMSRLFLRLFTSVMFLQFGIRQIINFDNIVPGFDGFWCLSPDTSVAVLVTLELFCAMCVAAGFLTRIAVFPLLGIMLYAEEMLLSSAGAASNQLFAFQPGYPLMFIGVFLFMLLAGPGKISLDYLIAIHIAEEKEDTEVLDKA